MEDPLRTPGFVAKRFGVAVSTVRYWVLVEIIKPHSRTPGGHMRFRDSEVERLWRESEGKNLGSKSVMASGTPSGTTPSVVTSAGKAWTPAITSQPRQGSPSSSSRESTSPLRAEAFLE